MTMPHCAGERLGPRPRPRNLRRALQPAAPTPKSQTRDRAHRLPTPPFGTPPPRRAPTAPAPMSSRVTTALSHSHTHHESLMASMMARSTPRVLLHSPVVRHIVTLLEVVAFFVALFLFVLLCAVHVRFVRNQGCASALFHLDSLFLPATASPNATATSTSTATSTCNAAAAPPPPQLIRIDVFHSSSLPPPSATSNPSAPHPRYSYTFAQERGLLLLSPRTLAALGVRVARVDLPHDHPCMWSLRPIANLLYHVVGYDTIVVNALSRLRRRVAAHNAYVRIHRSRTVLNLLHSDALYHSSAQRPALSRIALHAMHKAGAFITAVFILCTIVSLVAFTLREIQTRIIKLTIDLQLIMTSPAPPPQRPHHLQLHQYPQQRQHRHYQHYSRQQHHHPQLTYTHVIFRYATEALVFVPIIAGMLFFLFEFFDDQALAFAVLVITWLCEFAVTGSTRHWISRYYLPKFFFFYFIAFLIYFFAFPLGFSWLSFTTSLSWMVHAALAVWNHFELPLLRSASSSTS